MAKWKRSGGPFPVWSLRFLERCNRALGTLRASDTPSSRREAKEDSERDGEFSEKVTPQRRATFCKLLDIMCSVFGTAAFVVWSIATTYVMGWPRHRPLQPDPWSGRIYPYDEHGTIYVSAQDLFWWHVGLYTSWGLIAVWLTCGLLSQYLKKSAPNA